MKQDLALIPSKSASHQRNLATKDGPLALFNVPWNRYSHTPYKEEEPAIRQAHDLYDYKACPKQTWQVMMPKKMVMQKQRQQPFTNTTKRSDAISRYITLARSYPFVQSFIFLGVKLNRTLTNRPQRKHCAKCYLITSHC